MLCFYRFEEGARAHFFPPSALASIILESDGGYFFPILKPVHNLNDIGRVFFRARARSGRDPSMVKQRGRSRSYWSDSAGAVFGSSSAKISTGRQSVSMTRENGRSSRPRMSMPTRSRMRIRSPVQPLRKILGSVPYFLFPP